MSEKTVAAGTVRILLDAAEQVLGANGVNSLLNFAMMPSLIENRPGYGFEKEFTDLEYSRIVVSFYELLGVQGAKAIFRLIGKAIAKRIRDLGVLESFKDLPQKERLFKAVEIYALTSGRGRVFIEGNTIVFDNPACTLCFNLKNHKPICTVLNGFIDDLAIWAGYTGLRSVETRCKALGHESCRYEIVVD
jgi:predicted hydrocarbon binding protein